MKLLLVYATTEGQTQKIAGFVADHLARAGHHAEVVNAVDQTAEAGADPRKFDAIIMAASIHVGRYQAAIVDFVRNHLPAISTRPNVFLSVSLAASSSDNDDVQGLEQCLAHFCEQTGWIPQQTHHVAGAFRYTSYEFLKRWTMKYIAWRKGAPIDTSHDYELTDWADLARFIDLFVGKSAGARLAAG